MVYEQRTNAKMIYKHLVNFWPLAPAVDLQDVAKMFESCDAPADETFQSYAQKTPEVGEKHPLDKKITKKVNCLIAGDGIGSLIKTLTRFYRHDVDEINIFFAGSCSESLVRTILLLSLIIDASPKISMIDRAEIFLEVFGNTLLRYSTAAYIEEVSQVILEDLTSDGEFILPGSMISKSFLKQCEVDDLVEIITYLKNKEKSYDIRNAWESSLRSYYGSRYDARKNLYDYHFNMKLSDYSIINLRKYAEWSETGVAFKFRRAKFNVPNKTFRIRKSKSSKHFANKELETDCFLGDIATSPYLAFGVECGNADFFKKTNDQYVQNSADISKFNLIDMMNEFSALSKKLESKFKVIHVMLLERLLKAENLDLKFDIIYITCDVTGYADLILSKFLDGNGRVIFETVKNVVNSTRDQKQKHFEAILNLAKKLKLKTLCTGENTSFQVFVSSDEK